MLRLTTRVLALGLTICLAGQVYGQDKEKSSEPRIQKFEEVERGFWLRTTFGISVAVMNHFGDESRESPIWPPGPVVSLEMGYDFGQIASMHLTIQGQQVTGSRDMGTRSAVPNDSGAVSILLGARFNIITSKRLGWFLKAGVGYMLAIPDMALLDSGLVIQAGTGIEYATNLRHFFIGLEIGAQYLMANSGLGVLLTPTLKYTF
ncbi:MAG: adventurous gliding motility protein CglE [Deltaproteobacteria bacterium]|nr:adventurous gliding motility protein CglE [Deltaproteobacteria bacterium]